MNRRQMLRLAAAAPMINLGRVRLFGAEYSTRAVDLLKSSTVIDMLSPFALSQSRSRQWMMKPETFTAADLQNFRDSGIHAFHQAVGIGGPHGFMYALHHVTPSNSFLTH